MDRFSSEIANLEDFLGAVRLFVGMGPNDLIFMEPVLTNSIRWHEPFVPVNQVIGVRNRFVYDEDDIRFMESMRRSSVFYDRSGANGNIDLDSQENDSSDN